MSYVHRDWIADIRVGLVSVHVRNPEKYNCLSGLANECIFYKNGYQVLKDNGDFDHWEVKPEDVANAHLIAAAPDMYETLKQAREHLLMAEIKPDSYAIRNIDKVLAKAEGK
jgi:hypothetical protein